MSQKSGSAALWLSVLVLLLVNILNFYDRHVPGAVVEPMRKEFHLNDTQIGLLGSAFIWLYAIVGVPLGLLADRWSRKYLLALGVVVWAALTACTGLATTFGFLLFSRFGVGLGEAVCTPTASSWLGDLFPASQRSRVLALFTMAIPIGGGLGYLVGGPVAERYGWRPAMISAALPAVLIVPALLLLREPQRGASESNQMPVASAPIWNVLRIPTFWWIIASGAFLNFSVYAVATFSPALLSRVHGLSLANSNKATGTFYLLGGVAGALLSGYLGDAVIQRRKDGRLRYAAMTALLSIPLACIGILQPRGSVLIATIFLGLMYVCLSSYYGFVYSALQDFIAPNQRASAMAFYFLAMYLCGASYGPLLVGKISDLLAHRAAAAAGSEVLSESFRAVGLQQAMLIIPVLSFALAFVLYMGSRTIAADMDRRTVAADALLAASD